MPDGGFSAGAQDISNQIYHIRFLAVMLGNKYFFILPKNWLTPDSLCDTMDNALLWCSRSFYAFLHGRRFDK